MNTHHLHTTALVAAWHMMGWEAAYGHGVEAIRRAPGKAYVARNLDLVRERIANGGTLESIRREQPPAPPVQALSFEAPGGKVVPFPNAAAPAER